MKLSDKYITFPTVEFKKNLPFQQCYGISEKYMRFFLPLLWRKQLSDYVEA